MFIKSLTPHPLDHQRRDKAVEHGEKDEKVPDGGLRDGGVCDSDEKSVISGLWVAPGGSESIQKGRGAKPPTFLNGF